MVLSHVDCFCFTRILLLYSLFVLAFADPPYNFCSNTTIGSPVQYNLNNLFLSLHSNASVSKFYYTSIGIGPDRLFGLYMCLDYVTNVSCQDCITMASTDLTKLCPEAREAVMWEELCEVRYSYKDFYGPVHVKCHRKSFYRNKHDEYIGTRAICREFNQNSNM